MALVARTLRWHGAAAMLTLLVCPSADADPFETDGSRCSAWYANDCQPLNPQESINTADLANCMDQCALFSGFGSCVWAIFDASKTSGKDNCHMYASGSMEEYRAGCMAHGQPLLKPSQWTGSPCPEAEVDTDTCAEGGKMKYGVAQCTEGSEPTVFQDVESGDACIQACKTWRDENAPDEPNPYMTWSTSKTCNCFGSGGAAAPFSMPCHYILFKAGTMASDQDAEFETCAAPPVEMVAPVPPPCCPCGAGGYCLKDPLLGGRRVLFGVRPMCCE